MIKLGSEGVIVNCELCIESPLQVLCNNFIIIVNIQILIENLLS